MLAKWLITSRPLEGQRRPLTFRWRFFPSFGWRHLECRSGRPVPRSAQTNDVAESIHWLGSLYGFFVHIFSLSRKRRCRSDILIGDMSAQAVDIQLHAWFHVWIWSMGPWDFFEDSVWGGDQKAVCMCVRAAWANQCRSSSLRGNFLKGVLLYFFFFQQSSCLAQPLFHG